MKKIPFPGLLAVFGTRLTDLGGCDPLATVSDQYKELDAEEWLNICHDPCYLQPIDYNLWNPTVREGYLQFDTSLHVSTAKVSPLFGDDCNVPGAPGAAARANGLDERMADNALNRHATSYVERLSASRPKLESSFRRLRTEYEQIHADTNADHPDQRTATTTMAIFTFDFLWASDFRHHLTDKFWGALLELLDSEECPKNEIENRSVFSNTFHREIALPFMDLTEALSWPRVRSVPVQFENGWAHIEMALILVARNLFRAALDHVHVASRLLDQGNSALADQFQPAKAREVEECPLVGIAAMCIDTLIRNPDAGEQDQCMAYEDQVREVELLVDQEPGVRAHQSSIRTLKYEIESYVGILESQLSIVNDLITCTRPPEEQLKTEERLELLFTLVGPPRLDPLLSNLRSYLSNHIEHLNILCSDLEEVSRSHRIAMASNKDQQEAAIAAFTMVTVILLPLSWLSGVFGMNVIDIRELETGQWLYWVLAIPFATALGAGAWWLLGGNVKAYLRRRWRDEKERLRSEDHSHTPRGRLGRGSGRAVASMQTRPRVAGKERAAEFASPSRTSPAPERHRRPGTRTRRNRTLTVESFDV